MNKCTLCSKILAVETNKYCSNQCQQDHRYNLYIKQWRLGLKHGGRGLVAKNISGHIRRYLEAKYDNRCCLCGWSVTHAVTGKVPLEIDHIDGNSENNSEGNLRLICPNCHALTSNFRNLNKGSGRTWRKLKYLRTQ